MGDTLSTSQINHCTISWNNLVKKWAFSPFVLVNCTTQNMQQLRFHRIKETISLFHFLTLLHNEYWVLFNSCPIFSIFRLFCLCSFSSSFSENIICHFISKFYNGVIRFSNTGESHPFRLHFRHIHCPMWIERHLLLYSCSRK